MQLQHLLVHVDFGCVALAARMSCNLSVNCLEVPKPGCFQPGCLRFLRRSALLRSFVPSCALLRSFALLCGPAFALFCAHLCLFALICLFLRPTGFRASAFGNCKTAAVIHSDMSVIPFGTDMATVAVIPGYEVPPKRN